MFSRSLTCVFLLGLSVYVAACSACAHRPAAGVAPELAQVQAEWDREATLPTWNTLTLPPADPQLGPHRVVCSASRPSVEVDSDSSDSVGASFALDHPRGEPRAATLVVPCGPTDMSCFVTAHHVDGVRVVDARDPSQAHVSAPQRLPPAASAGWIRALHGVGPEALVVRAMERGYELLWLSIDPQQGPKLVHAERAEGDFRGSYIVTDAGGARYLALIVDRYDRGVCPMRVGSFLRTLRLDAWGTSNVQEVALGVEVARVIRAGSLLLLVEQGEGGSHGLRLVDMAEPKSPALFAERFGLGYYAAHELAGSSLHMVSTKASRMSESRRHIERTLSLQTIQLEKAALDGSFAPRVESECSLMVEQLAQPGDIPVGKFRGALHGAEDSELFFTAAEPGLIDRRRIRRASCEEERSQLAGYAPRALSEGLLFDADFATPGQSTIRITDRRKPAHSTAQAQVRLAPQGKRAESGIRASNAFWEASDVWSEPDRRALASLTFHEVDGEGIARLGSQLIEIRDGRPSVAAKLSSRLWQLPAAGPAVALGATGLEFWDLTDPHAPTRMADVPLWPRYLSAALLPAGTARLRHPSPSGKHDPLTGHTLARLEFVGMKHDSQLAQARDGIDVSANARLYAVGKYVVSVAQELGRDEHKQTRPCEIRVFELSAEAQLEEVASLLEHEMCSAQHALGSVFALPQAIVFARAEHTSEEGPRTAFFVLSLKEPKSARIVGPFRTPKGELSEQVSSDGALLYNFFRVPSLGTHVGKPGFNHYVRSIDFSLPDHPRLGEAIALRGEPMLRDGDAVYTREGRKTARGPLWIVRKLLVKGDAAHVSLTREVYGTALHWLQTTERAGQLLAGFWGPGQQEGAGHFFRGLIDAATLDDLKGIAPVEPSTLVGVQAGRALRLEDGVLTWSELGGAK